MSDFTGQKIANTYKNLLQVNTSNTDLSSSLITVQTGAGNNTPLQLATDKIRINGGTFNVSATFQLNGNTITDFATSAAVKANTDAITSINTVVTSVNSLGVAVSALTKTNLDAITSINTVVAGVSVLTKTNLDAVTSINTVVTNLSATMATSIATRTAAITSINTVVTSVNSLGVAVSALTKTNLDAITSINTVVTSVNSLGVAVSALTKTNLDAITSINTVVGTLSATMATSINNRTTAIATNTAAITSINTVVAGVSVLTKTNLDAVTSINTVVTNLSATLATSIGTRTAAITSINTVVTNLSATMATSIANVSALTKTNLDAVTSINTVVGNLSSTLATSIGNRTGAITSINSVITALSATMATSIGTRTAAITSINTVVTNLSATMATSVANRTGAITSINTVVTNLSATMATSIANRTAAITSINAVIDSGGSGTTINNNADNRIITGSGTANTLNGEANLTFDGTNLDLADSKLIRLGAGADLTLSSDGTNGTIAVTNGNLIIDNQHSNGDISFKGTDDSSDITALTLDMSGGGVATFNGGLISPFYFYSTTDGTIVLYAGANFEIALRHVHNTGFLLTNTGTGTPEVELQFVDSNESIGSDGTDLTVKSGADINLTATTDINIPSNVGLTFGNDGEKIEGDGTDLTISGNNINLTATADVVIPNNVGIVFGGASEKIEGDGTDMTISANNLTVDAEADITLDANGADIKLADNGTVFGELTNESNYLVIKNPIQDQDIQIKGNDNGGVITALALDMSAAGAATFNNDVTAFSDKRLKTDIEPIENALEKVMKMQGVYYKRNDTTNARKQIGVIAQEIEPILPEVVLTADDEMQTKSVDYGKICSILIESIKELKNEIEELKAR